MNQQVNKRMKFVIMVLVALMCLLFPVAIASGENYDIEQYRNMLMQCSDMDYSATCVTMRSLCATLSSKVYAKDSSGRIDTSIYQQLGCIDTVVVSKPDAVIGCLLDKYGQPIIIVTFQGSQNDMFFEDWRYNLDFWKSNNGIHQGFDNQYSYFRNAIYDYRFTNLPGQPNFIELMEAATNGKGPHFIVTGHSLGGALAQVMIYDLSQRAVSNENMVAYTFAAPTPFCLDDISSEFRKGLFVHNYINAFDLVPAIGLGGFDKTYKKSGNIGCNYYVSDGMDPKDKYLSSIYEVLINKVPPRYTTIKIVKAIMSVLGAEHDIAKYVKIISNQPILVENQDFTPTTIDESVFQYASSNSNGFTYTPTYFDRVKDKQSLSSMLNGYVTSFPQTDPAYLEGLAEYNYGSNVSEVGFFLGDSRTSLPQVLTVSINKGTVGEFSTSFRAALGDFFINRKMRYYQAYAIINDKRLVGRIEEMSSKSLMTDVPISDQNNAQNPVSAIGVYTIPTSEVDKASPIVLQGRVESDTQMRVSRVGMLAGPATNALAEIGYDEQLPDRSSIDFYYQLNDNLEPSAIYYYQAYAEMDGVRYYGDVMQFKTDVFFSQASAPEDVQPAWSEMKMLGGNIAGYKVGDLWGIILMDGTVVCEPKYNSIIWHPFTEELKVVAMGDSGCFVLSMDSGLEMEQTGFGFEGGGVYWDVASNQLVSQDSVNFTYTTVENTYGLGMFYCVDSSDPQKVLNKLVLVDTNSQAVNNEMYDEVFLPYDNSYVSKFMGDSYQCALGIRDQRCYIVDRAGNESQIGENAGSFFAGVAPFEKDGKWGYIDSNGVVILEPQYDAATSIATYNSVIYAWVLDSHSWKVITF